MTVDHFYRDIPGWFDYLDVYERVVAGLPDGAHIVEVGVYHGQSTAGLCVEIANSGKAIRLDVVDHFNGSEREDWTVPDDLRARFDANIAPVRHLIRNVHAMKSTEAAALYAPASLDFVWIDAAHDPQSVLEDLEAWWPAVKPGGLFAGHDADWPTVQRALAPWSALRGLVVESVSVRSWAIRKPVPQSDWQTPAGARKCLVAVASNERTIYRQTAESLAKIGWGARVSQAASAHGFEDVQFSWVSRHVRVDDLRNEAGRLALAAGATHLLFLDADMTWPGDVLTRMLAHHDKGIVSGLYFLKSWPHWPVAFASGAVNLKTGEVDYTYDDAVVAAGGLRPSALVGMGCTLIPTALLSLMPEPWFEYRENRSGLWTITEDVAFCQKAAAYGCPIWVDPSVKCRHVGPEMVGEEHFMRARVEADALAELQRARSAPKLAEAVPA